MAWQATITSINVSTGDPRVLPKINFTFTDGTLRYDKIYSLPEAYPPSIGEIKDFVFSELSVLSLRDTNAVSLSSWVGTTVQLSSGRLVIVSSDQVITPPT